VIIIAPYDPKWPRLFDDEAARIREVFGQRALRIDHVGSTSVPGLAAKPVIDIQVSVQSLQKRQLHEELMEQLGYTHFPLGDFDLVYPFFKRPASWPSTHHVHLCEVGSVEERDHLAFRDYLRANADAAARYAALKRELAARHHGQTMASQERYSLDKSDFICSALGQSVPSARGATGN
jgi:GrpB-like predicted nucleotidyltransferase (UPF0157 family)